MSRPIIIKVGSVELDMGGHEQASHNLRKNNRKFLKREDGNRGGTAVPFNRCFVDSFDIVVT